MSKPTRFAQRAQKSTIAAFALILWAESLFAQGSIADQKQQPPPLKRVGEEAYRAISEFFSYDRGIPLEARTVEKKDVNGSSREKIVLRTTQGFLAPGYLHFPRKGVAPYPCVLLLHGWSGSKESWYKDNGYISGGNVRKGLLDAGCAVFALDAQCHGDRVSQNDFAPVNHYIDKQVDTPRKGYFTQREIYLQTVVDYRRALDYLETREEIDSARIGLIGYSMGGTQTFLLAAVEQRIKVAVACAVPADTKPYSLIAPQNYARGIGKRPLLMVMGDNDPMCSVARAKELYHLIESASTNLMFFGGDHRLTVDYVPHALEWLKTQL